MAEPIRVALFVTCLVDLFRPSVGFAAVKLLEDAGCTVDVPAAQSCCGQPAYNSGDRADAKAIARQVIETFAGYDYVVVPSGSCGGMIKTHYPALFADEPTLAEQARALAARTYELVSFLADVLKLDRVAARHAGTVTYHDACSGLRELGIKDQPRQLLASVAGLTLKEMATPEVCCGFGGTFCVKYPEISDKMVSDKVADIVATSADTLLCGDMGCLLNMAGKLSRLGKPVSVRHVAEVLAEMSDEVAPDRRAAGGKEFARALMEATSHNFKANAHRALGDANLQRAMGMMRSGFPEKRAQAIARLPEFDSLRDEGVAIKNHTIAHLDFYLERFEQKVLAQGGKVHWCRNAQEARETVLGICRALDAKTVTKGKSMVGEEIAINDFLEANGITPVETDLGEYIVQLRKEPPSHIIAPAVHLIKEQVADSFRATHTHLPHDRNLEEPRVLCDEARAVLREKFLAADVGITGANFLVAETGSSIIVTNEGNGDLTQLLPKAHVVLASLEKIVPTLEDATTLLRLLARSATGQEFSTYTTISTGPRRAADADGPGEYHVVLIDNGRSALLGGEFQDMLRCIRCAACLNHCPVYGAIGGHAYGWVYSGPMGAVLTPTLIGIEEAGNLPNASTFCGRCESVCPMRIPLPKMMRQWREREFSKHLSPKTQRWGLALWAYVARRPALYRRLSALAARALSALGGAHGKFRSLPLASGWTDMRDLPAPEGKSFMTLWAERKRKAS